MVGYIAHTTAEDPLRMALDGVLVLLILKLRC